MWRPPGILNGGLVEKPLYADVLNNTYLTQHILDLNKFIDRPIDHALEEPDTVIDDCTVRRQRMSSTDAALG